MRDSSDDFFSPLARHSRIADESPDRVNDGVVNFPLTATVKLTAVVHAGTSLPGLRIFTRAKPAKGKLSGDKYSQYDKMHQVTSAQHLGWLFLDKILFAARLTPIQRVNRYCLEKSRNYVFLLLCERGEWLA